MDPAGEHDMEFLGMRRFRCQQHVDGRLPQGETASRPNVAAALSPLKDELAHPVANEALEQARGGNVQVSRDAVVFKLAGLGRPPAMIAWLGRTLQTWAICRNGEMAKVDGSLSLPDSYFPEFMGKAS